MLGNWWCPLVRIVASAVFVLFRSVFFVLLEMATSAVQGRATFSGLLEDEDDKDIDEILSETAEAFTDYLNLDIRKEKSEFTENVDELLTRLDEFCGLVDVIRSDTTLCLNKTLPAIHAKSQQMQDVFEKIDKLEAFVQMVGNTVSESEAKLNKAESDLVSSNSFMKLLSSPFFSKKSAAKQPRSSTANQYDPPRIFHTEDYIQYNHPELSSCKTKSSSDSPSPSLSVSQSGKLKSNEKSTSHDNQGTSNT